MFQLFTILPHLSIHLQFVFEKVEKCTPNNRLVKIHKLNHVNFKIVQKWVAATISSIHNIFFMLIEFEQQK
jgi:hypothetical protein